MGSIAGHCLPQGFPDCGPKMGCNTVLLGLLVEQCVEFEGDIRNVAPQTV